MQKDSSLTAAIPKIIAILFAIALVMVAVHLVDVGSKTVLMADDASFLDAADQARVPFIENEGQVQQESVRFYAQTFGGTLFVEDGGILTYSFPMGDGMGAVIKEFLSNQETSVPVGIDPSHTDVSYFIGSDPANWNSDLLAYDVVSYGELYDGIDVCLKAYGNNVEKIFTVQPGAHPESIKVRVEGAQDIRVDEYGQLELETPFGMVKFTEPIAFQESDGNTERVEVAYTICNQQTYGFHVGAYDSSLPLIIDPLLASTFIGGESDDASMAVVIDDSTGNVYMAGYTASSGYPTYPGG